jgi:cardiolipin synthase A/B
MSRRLFVPICILLVFFCVTIGVTVELATVHAQPPYTLRLPTVYAPPVGNIVIAAAHIDSALTGEADEAILLWNASRVPITLARWTLEVNGRSATFPSSGAPALPPGARIWCAAEAATFRMSFGETPGCEWAADSDPAVFNLEGSNLQLTNTGAAIRLRDPQGVVVDTLLYGNEVGPLTGWQGTPVQVYDRGAIARQGQVWQRKLAPSTGLPIDYDVATDWASDLADVNWGRRVRFPGWGGWSAEDGALPVTIAANATITVAIAPEGLYTPIATTLTRATHSIHLSLYTFEHPELAQIIAGAAQRGVHVRLLLEGGPPGGISDLQRWCVRLMAQAGVDVRYLASQGNAPRGLQPRYRYTHAKYGIVDGKHVLVGSENFGWDAMPVTGTMPVGGRRGAYLFTDAQPVADAFANLFATDWSPDRFFDLHPYAPSHAQYGDPPPDYTLPAPPLYPVEAAPFGAPFSGKGAINFQVIAAPENALRPDTGIHALIQQAGAGDELYLTQLYEHKY